MQIKLGDTNQYGVTVVNGPEKVRNTLSWGMQCPFCKDVFVAPTTNFRWAKSCYSCRGEALKSYDETTTMDYLYHVIKGRKAAKEKGFGLTKECFNRLSVEPCYYCGAQPTETSGYKPWHPKVMINGLDRIDPAVGYYDHNVVPCCKDCNVAKLDKTEEEFISWARRLVGHQNTRDFTATAITAKWTE